MTYNPDEFNKIYAKRNILLFSILPCILISTLITFYVYIAALDWDKSTASTLIDVGVVGYMIRVFLWSSIFTLFTCNYYEFLTGKIKEKYVNCAIAYMGINELLFTFFFSLIFYSVFIHWVDVAHSFFISRDVFMEISVNGYAVNNLTIGYASVVTILLIGMHYIYIYSILNLISIEINLKENLIYKLFIKNTKED